MSLHKLTEHSQPSNCAEGFRDAIRQLPGGVSDITVGRGDERSGLTVTSVSSLSLDPPMLIVCVIQQHQLAVFLVADADHLVLRMSGSETEEKDGEDQSSNGPVSGTHRSILFAAV